MATRQLRVEIVGDPRRIMRTFDSIDRSAGRMAKGFSRATTLVGAGLAAMAGGAVVSAIKSMVDEARQAEKVGRQTAAVIKATGGVAKVSAKDVDRLATALSNKVGVDDEIIQAGQNMMLTFKNVRNEAGKQNDIFNQTTRVALDMTAALNQGEVSQQGLEQTTMRLGKALNDPIAGISALTRVGVTFTDKQKEQIKTLVESGKTMDAQKLILRELASEFGGAAEAAADPWQRLGVIFGNIKERIGAALLPMLERAASFVTDKLVPAAERWWKDHGPKVVATFKAIADVINVEIKQAFDRIKRLLDEDVVPAFQDLSRTWDDNKQAFNELMGAMDTGTKNDLNPLAAVVKMISTNLKVFITVLGAVARALQFVLEHTRGLQQFIDRAMIAALRGLVGAFVTTFQSILRVSATAAEAMRLPWARSLRSAERDIGNFRATFNKQMDALQDERVNLNVRGTFQPPAGMSMRDIVFRAGGGPVSGPGTATSDSVPAMLSAGEHVISAREVAGMGGHAAVEAMRRQARGFAAGGAITLHQTLPPAGGLAAAAERAAARIADLVAANVRATAPIAAAFPPHAAGGWRMATQFLGALGIPYSVISSFRPGARTRASGSVSYHALNRAVDIAGPNMLRIFEALARTNPTELIYSGADRYKSRRGWRPIGALDPITLADHWSHVHAAYDRGGWLPPGVSVAVNRTGRPERVLAPGDSGLTVNFYGPVYGDRRAITETVRQGLKEALRQEGKGALAAQL